VLRARSQPLRAQGQVLSAKCVAQKPTGPISRPAKSKAAADRGSKAGAGLRSSPGGEGCEKHKGRIFQSAWWPRGLLLLQKKISVSDVNYSGRSVAPVGAPTTGSCWLAGFAGYLPAMEIHSGIVQEQILPRGKQPAKPANQRWLQRPTGKLRAQRLEFSTSGLARGAR